MTTYHLHEALRTVVPAKDDERGFLAPIFLLLTVVSGLVDAFSYLLLGHAFVANMTGNVIFLGFTVAGAPGFTAWASTLAIGVFVLGAFAGGRIAHHFGTHRERLLTAISIQGVLVVAAFVFALTAQGPAGFDTTAQIVLIALLAAGLGIQNATARFIGVPDLTTTVLTLTIVGIAADGRAAGGRDSRIGRRLLSVLSIFVGAAIGAVLVLAHVGVLVLLVVAMILGVAAVLSVRVPVPVPAAGPVVPTTAPVAVLRLPDSGARADAERSVGRAA